MEEDDDDDDDDDILFVISDFCRGVNQIFALLRCYATYIGSQLSTFREKIIGYHFKGKAVEDP